VMPPSASFFRIPEDESSRFLQNVSSDLQDYTASHPRRLWSLTDIHIRTATIHHRV
jgi:hypothetical protein